MRCFGDWLIERFVVFLHGFGEPEIIGDLDRSVRYRWTLFARRWCRVSIYHFAPHMIDMDSHDHSRSFVTLTLTGEYIDIDEGGGEPKWELMRRAAVAYRSARHTHRVQVSSGGAWLIVFMGPVVRSPLAPARLPSISYRCYKGTGPPT